MNQQSKEWVKVWEELVLPDYHEHPERGLEARLPQEDRELAADLVGLARRGFPEAMLTVELMDGGDEAAVFVLFAASLSGTFTTSDPPGLVVVDFSFRSAVDRLRTMLEARQN
jgi:hypothetical protein